MNPTEFPRLLHCTNELAAWMMDIARAAPAFRHGAGRALQPCDRESIIGESVAEFVRTDSAGRMPAIERLMSGRANSEGEALLRHALWHRVAELVSQGCENRDPEFKHARTRLRNFLRISPPHDIVQIELFHVRYLTIQSGVGARHLPVIPRDELLRRFLVPADARKYGEGLGEFLAHMLGDLERWGRYRPWLALDDMAFLLARAEEAANRQEWMSETAQTQIVVAESEVLRALTDAGETVLAWFDGQYAPGKSYSGEVREGLRRAFLDHVRTLSSDPGNHPGLQALLLFHLPEVTSGFRNSNIRKDFEYMVKLLREEVRERLKRLESG